MGWIDRLLEQPPTADAARKTFRRAIRSMVVQAMLLAVCLAMLIFWAPASAPTTGVLALAAFGVMMGQSTYYALDAKSAYHRLAQSNDA